jgi:hypothetical protein
MDAELGRRQLEDQPAVTGIDMFPAEHVPEQRSQLLGLWCIEQDVRAGDCHDPRL